MQFSNKGWIGVVLVSGFVLMAIYAPFLASSKPFIAYFDGEIYFPLFRYLLFSGFYTKAVDLFFNALIFTIPLAFFCGRYVWRWLLWGLIQLGLFFWALGGGVKDPAWRPESRYAELNGAVQAELIDRQQALWAAYGGDEAPTLWNQQKDQQGELYQKKRIWLEEQRLKLRWMIMPLVRPLHWEDEAGGSQALNGQLPWLERTRSNRKDLTAALIFGTRICIVVGFLSTLVALAIGVPIGALSGYYAGRVDLWVSRFLEVWESLPTLFMLLFVTAILQTKTIFLVIAAIGFFGWTGFARYVRGEMLKQRSLPYAEACVAMGFSRRYILFTQLLPNAVFPLWILLPFAMMGAITSEAGLSFLGLGEEGSCSWGVLMDEGRTAFPAEAYLLWPPALLLTLLLIAIALVGDALRDFLDPRMKDVMY